MTQAQSLDEAVRVRQSASAASPPELLSSLAEDVSITVRAALALNPRTPPRATEMLARDADERVRALLARRLTALLPGMPQGESRRMQEQAIALLHRLVNDQAVRVRAAIADAVKDLPAAPRDLVLHLAGDGIGAVCCPVIRLSPVLTDEDLLALLAAPASAATVSAVARRPDLGPRLSDMIVASEDAEAIRALLENRSAQIRENALDAVIARSADHTDWHDPLVRRPALSDRAARALAGIVAADLLAVLARRPDFSPSLADELQRRLQERLALDAMPPPECDLSTEDALTEATRLRAGAALDGAALLAALSSGRPRLAAAMLAVAADLPIAAVDRATSLRSPKALVSLVWAAGFGMATAGAVQSVMGAVAPGALLKPAADGGFPLAQAEMRWQLDFLRQSGR